MPEYRSSEPRSDLTYDRTTGTLYCWTSGDSWKANSGWRGSNRPGPSGFRMPQNWEHGSWGARARDPLPSGRYRTGLRQLKAARSGIYKKAAFTDPQGFYWFLHIIRTDDTSRRRSQFGIHPDGHPPGTHGCIGLTENSTEPAFEKLKDLIGRRGDITIDVI